MAWKQTDYNLNTIHKKSAKAINAEYKRLHKSVSARVSTFEKHHMGGIQEIREMRQVLSNQNKSRRDKEMAIMEMRRFTQGETKSYTHYVKNLSDTIETLRGYGMSVNEKNIGEVLSFLDWVKSFTSYNYQLNVVIHAWKQAKGNVEGAMEIFKMLYTSSAVQQAENKRRAQNINAPKLGKYGR